MARRRLILAACVAVVALGAAWWMFTDRLTAEEWQLVGAWRYDDAAAGKTKSRFALTPDRRVFNPDFPDRAPWLWCIEGSSLVFEHEPNAARRIFRPLAGLLGLRVLPCGRFPFEVTGDMLTVHAEYQPPSVWIRDRGD
jgi:hypothetical protein